ncbi:MAG: alkane 1-monooxygenase [Kiritimatiellia bacterium]
MFGVIPALELVMPLRRDPGRPERRASFGHELVLWGLVPMQFALIAGLWARASFGAPPVELLGDAVSVGMCSALYGLNVGHELGHRGGRAARWVAPALMGSSLYAHFWVEHNRGHHVNVGTPADPATARRGEWLYTFWIRSTVGGLLSAYRLDRRWVLTALIAQALAWVTVLVVLGPVPALTWIGASAVGILLLETVNYVEHYGLTRQQRPDGSYERIQPWHSWNAEQTAGAMLLFNLTRHADHHAHPTRAYHTLRRFADGPQLPAGYTSMILVALVPPLFHALVHRSLDRLQQPVDA